MTCDICEMDHTPELAKSLVTTLDVAEMMGYEPDSQGRIQSFAQEGHYRNNLQLYDGDGGWHDFFTGEGGDVISFVQKAADCSFSRALTLIIHRSLKAGREPGAVEKQPVKILRDFTDEFPPLVELEDWEKRLGIPIPRGYVTASDGDLLIGHADQNGIYGVKVRQRGGGKSSWTGSQFGHRLYDPYGWFERGPRGRKICLIAEGESDAWALKAAMPDSQMSRTRLTVLALPSGAGTWRDSWLEDLQGFEQVWLCMDNDRAGEQARDKLTSKIGYLKVEQLRVPPLYNDAREAIVAGWRPSLTC